jgi:hypothetical protein
LHGGELEFADLAVLIDVGVLEVEARDLARFFLAQAAVLIGVVSARAGT